VAAKKGKEILRGERSRQERKKLKKRLLHAPLKRRERPKIKDSARR